MAGHEKYFERQSVAPKEILEKLEVDPDFQQAVYWMLGSEDNDARVIELLARVRERYEVSVDDVDGALRRALSTDTPEE